MPFVNYHRTIGLLYFQYSPDILKSLYILFSAPVKRYISKYILHCKYSMVCVFPTDILVLPYNLPLWSLHTSIFAVFDNYNCCFEFVVVYG